MSGEIKFSVRNRDDRGTDFTLHIPNVQGKYDISIRSSLYHHVGHPERSWADPEIKGTVNGQEFSCVDVYEILGHNCMNRGEDIYAAITDTLLRDDFQSWENWLCVEALEVRYEQRLQNTHYERAAI